MSSILLHHPLGLGDHLICNGLVREYCKRYERVGIFCFAQNYPSISFMYRDLTNLHIQKISSHKEAQRFSLLNQFTRRDTHWDEIKTIGSFDQESGIMFERQFYKMAGIELEKKWDSFFVLRDKQREEDLFKKVCISLPYAFIHDDVRYPIDLKKITSALSWVKPDTTLTDNIFDWGTLIERAEEVHVIDSSFMFLVDCLECTNPKQRLFVHRYARQNAPWNMPLLKKRWEILV